MKKILIAATVVIAGAGAAVATPYYIGMQAQKRFAQTHERIQQEIFYPQLSVTAGDYKKGWLDSEASTVFTFTPNKKGAAPLVFTLVHHISNLPSLADGALMSVDSELVLPDKMAKNLEPYFKGQALLHSHTIVKFDGSEYSTITSPRYSGPLKGDENGKLDWQGLTATTTSDASMRHVSVTLDVPSFSLEKSDGVMHLAKLHYTTHIKRGSHDLWFGHDKASLDKLQFRVISPRRGPTDMQMSKLSLTSNQSENGPLVNIQGRFSFDSANLNGLTLQNGVYDVAYNNLDAASLAELSNGIKAAMRHRPDDPRQLFAGLKPRFQALLSKKAELSISELTVDTPIGKTNGKLKLALTDKLSDEVMQDPRGLLNIMNVDIEASLPKPMVIGFISTKARNSLRRVAQAQKKKLTDEELAQKVGEVTQQQLQQLLGQKLMVDNGANYDTVIHYVPHQLEINGQDATPMLNGLAQN